MHKARSSQQSRMKSFLLPSKEGHYLSDMTLPRFIFSCRRIASTVFFRGISQLKSTHDISALAQDTSELARLQVFLSNNPSSSENTLILYFCTAKKLNVFLNTLISHGPVKSDKNLVIWNIQRSRNTKSQDETHFFTSSSPLNYFDHLQR